MSEIKRVNKDNFWAKAEVSAAASLQQPGTSRTRHLDVAGDLSSSASSLSNLGSPAQSQGSRPLAKGGGWTGRKVGKQRRAGLAAEVLLPRGARGGGN